MSLDQLLKVSNLMHRLSDLLKPQQTEPELQGQVERLRAAAGNAPVLHYGRACMEVDAAKAPKVLEVRGQGGGDGQRRLVGSFWTGCFIPTAVWGEG